MGKNLEFGRGGYRGYFSLDLSEWMYSGSYLEKEFGVIGEYNGGYGL